MNQLFLDKSLQNYKLWFSEGSLPPTEAAKFEETSNGCWVQNFVTISQKVSTVPIPQNPAKTILQSFTRADIAEIAVFKKKSFLKPSPYHANPYCSSNISDSKKEKQRKFLASQGYIIEGVLILNFANFSVLDHMKWKINEKSIHGGCMNFKDLIWQRPYT